MIVIKVIGGLGNQIAQYAFGLSLKYMFSIDVKLDITSFDNYTLHKYELNNYFLELEEASDDEIKIAKKMKVVLEDTLLFDEKYYEGLQVGSYFDGYWGDFRYSINVLQQLRKTFNYKYSLNSSALIIEKLVRNSNSVSVHIRRGDYVTNTNCFLLPIQYYIDSILYLANNLNSPKFFFFSDDVEWVKENLKIPFDHLFVSDAEEITNIEDFELIRLCKHHINANSTFSTWASRLNTNGIVISPQKHFKEDDHWLISNFGSIFQPLLFPNWISMPIKKNIKNSYLDIAGGHNSNKPITIAVHSFYEELSIDGFLFKNKDSPIGHNLLKPFGDLYAYGRQHGINFVTLDQIEKYEDLEAIIFLDRPSSNSELIFKVMSLNIKKYLVIYETPVVKADNWDVEYHKLFDRIFTWNDSYVDGIRYIKINWPIDTISEYDFEVAKTLFHQRKLCVMISGNKKSEHPSELYSRRKETIRWFENNASNDFDLFGFGWDISEYPSFSGLAANKLQVLTKYRFSICYENATNFPGYITEKILDCFLSCVVPVYLGAANIEDWIPKECYVDRRSFDNDSDMYKFISEMDADSYNQYLDNINFFLNSAKSYPFSIECFITTISSFIVKDVRLFRNEIPKITVAIPTYNNSRYLRDSIESVLNQNIDDLELIVLDNFSSDETLGIVFSYSQDRRVRYVRNTRNIGGPYNWRNAYRISCGNYIAILSGDDFFMPVHLLSMLDSLENNLESSLAYCPCIWIDELNKPITVMNHPGHFQANYVGGRDEVSDLLIYDSYITPSAAVIRRAVLDEIGEIDLDLKGAHDYDFWIRVAEFNSNFIFHKSPTVCYRIHDSQDTKFQIDSGYVLSDFIRILRSTIERKVSVFSKSVGVKIYEALVLKFQSFPEHIRLENSHHLTAFSDILLPNKFVNPSLDVHGLDESNIPVPDSH
jgi:glycosyltransferase involved in cell wall biosynthesis